MKTTWSKDEEFETIYKEAVCSFIYEGLSEYNNRKGYYLNLFKNRTVDENGNHCFEIKDSAEIKTIVKFMVPEGNYEAKEYVYYDCMNNNTFSYEAISGFAMRAKIYEKALKAESLEKLQVAERCEGDRSHIYFWTSKLDADLDAIEKSLVKVENNFEEECYNRIAHTILEMAFDNDFYSLLKKPREGSEFRTTPFLPNILNFDNDFSFLSGLINVSKNPWDNVIFYIKIDNKLKEVKKTYCDGLEMNFYSLKFSFYFLDKYISGEYCIPKSLREGFNDLRCLAFGNNKYGEYARLFFGFR